MKRNEVVYMAISADKYELPLALFLNTKEMAAWVGQSREVCLCNITRNVKNKKGKFRLVRVYVGAENG